MSIHVTGWVWNLRLPPMEKLLLLMLSDFADDFGDSIFPAFDTLEQKTGMSRMTVKRTLQKLLTLGLVVRTARHTPVSPNFYRIVGVPALDADGDRQKEPQCPQPLRRAVLYAFNGRCEYCGRYGFVEIGPDGRPWQIERLVSSGTFVPENVTLACRTCTTKRPKPTMRLRSLSERQQESPDHGGRAQIEPSPLPFELSTESVPLLQDDSGGGLTVSPGGGLSLSPGRAQMEGGGGLTVSPDPSIDPSMIRQ